jgi:outer membrane receptor for ferrienterochelin and colicins
MKIRNAITLSWAGLFLLLAASLTGGAYAGETVSPMDSVGLEELEKTVEQLTDLARETHLNADYVPGMVTVLYGRDLEDRGIRSAGEALNLVPGMNLSHTSQIFWKIVARSVPKPLAAGHIKLLLNGTPLTTTFGIDLVPNLPIEQVDRIEIVRGPASAINGEHAVTGVVNIITHEKGKCVYGSSGSYSTFLGGGLMSIDFPDMDFKISLNISGAQSYGSDVKIGMGAEGAMNGIGDPQLPQNDFEGLNQILGSNYRESRTGLLSLQWRETSIRVSFLEQDRRDWYNTRQLVVAAHQRIFLTPSLTAEAGLTILKRRFDSDLENEPLSAWEKYTEGWIYEFNYNEQKVEANFDLTWDFQERYSSLLGYSFTHSDISDVRRVTSPEELIKGDDRRIHNLRFQEEWQPHDQVIFTGDVQYDQYSDIGDRISPTISGVFRMNAEQGAIRQHILKAQYGRSFRPPTFLESHVVGIISNTELETMDTYELGYITRRLDETFRLTGFHSNLSQPKDETPHRLERYRIDGMEVEYMRPLITDSLDLDLNLSYTKVRDQETGEHIPGSADFLSNVGLIFKPIGWMSLSVQLHSVFDRNEDPALGKGLSPDYHLLDGTVCLRYPKMQDLVFRGGVKNLLKGDFRSPNESTEWGYESYDRPGRFWWLSLSYQF